jgi:hypothetical protein
MSDHSINNPKHWLDRAKEARALAEQMGDPEARRSMLRNADDYANYTRHDERVAPQRIVPMPEPELPESKPQYVRVQIRAGNGADDAGEIAEGRYTLTGNALRVFDMDGRYSALGI